MIGWKTISAAQLHSSKDKHHPKYYALSSQLRRVWNSCQAEWHLTINSQVPRPPIYPTTALRVRVAGASPQSPLDVAPLSMVGKGDHSPSKMRMDFQGQSTQFQFMHTPAVDRSASAARPWLNTDIVGMKLNSLKNSAPAPPICV